MDWIYTGYARSLLVKITKTINGATAPGYPKYYNGRNDSGFLSSYPAYPSISDDAAGDLILAQMDIVDFNARLADFKTWVEFMEPGLDFDIDLTIDARILNEDCTTTTTTTEAPS